MKINYHVDLTPGVYVINEDKKNELQGLSLLLAQQHHANKDLEKSYKQFVFFFSRIVGFSSLEVQKVAGTSWDQIQQGDYITAGWINSDLECTSPLRYHKDGPLDVYQVLFWNRLQLPLLTSMEFRLVVLCADYGSGRLIWLYYV